MQAYFLSSFTSRYHQAFSLIHTLYNYISSNMILSFNGKTYCNYFLLTKIPPNAISAIPKKVNISGSESPNITPNPTAKGILE